MICLYIPNNKELGMYVEVKVVIKIYHYEN